MKTISLFSLLMLLMAFSGLEIQAQSFPESGSFLAPSEGGTAPRTREGQRVRPDNKSQRKSLRKQLRSHKPALRQLLRQMKQGRKMGKFKRTQGGKAALIIGILLLVLAFLIVLWFALLVAAGELAALLVFLLFGPLALVALILGTILIISGSNVSKDI